MGVNKAENRRRKTAKVGKYDYELNRIPLGNENGNKGRSQKGCFGKGPKIPKED